MEIGNDIVVNTTSIFSVFMLVLNLFIDLLAIGAGVLLLIAGKWLPYLQDKRSLSVLCYIYGGPLPL